MKKYTAKEAKAKREEKVEAIMAQLETGVDELFSSDKYKTYLDTMSKFYSYSLYNCMLIAMQTEGKASYIAGYKAWQDKFNRHVKSGEKALSILAPIPHKYKKKVQNEDGTTEEVEGNYLTYRVVSVFDISQTEGEELPSIVVDQLPESEMEKRNKRLFARISKLANIPVSVEKLDDGSHGYFSPAKGVIVVKDGMTSTQTLKTLIHELAHSKLHGKGCEFEKADRHTMEVQAESVAYVVCSHLGIDTAEYSFGYVAGWSKGKEHKELEASLKAIKKIATEIISGIETK